MKINILGYGVMGKQIAALFYLGGYDIAIWDKYEIDHQELYRQIELLKFFFKSNLTGNITFVNSLDGLENNLTIESVIEDIQTKKEIYNFLKTRISKSYFSNTSSYAPSEISGEVNGLHFFNPISLRIVELYLFNKAKNDELKDILKYLRSADFKIIEVHDNRGYAANYLLFHEISSALKLIEAFGYSVNAVEGIYKNLYNGRDIFKIIDIIGVDVVYKVLNNLKEKYETIYLARCLEEAIEKNILGKKNKTSIRGILDKKI